MTILSGNLPENLMPNLYKHDRKALSDIMGEFKRIRRENSFDDAKIDAVIRAFASHHNKFCPTCSESS